MAVAHLKSLTRDLRRVRLVQRTARTPPPDPQEKSLTERHLTDAPSRSSSSLLILSAVLLLSSCDRTRPNAAGAASGEPVTSSRAEEPSSRQAVDDFGAVGVDTVYLSLKTV